MNENEATAENSMRVIITGGTGLIGRALTNQLADRGYEIIVLSRHPGSVTGLPENARAVGWDTYSADGWGHLADGAKAVVNLAGESIAGNGFLPERWTPEKRHRIRQSRLEAGQAVVDAVRQADVKPDVVIQSSAVGYYGTQGDEIITEASPPGDDFLANVCVDWEASTAAVEEMGVRRAIIRTGLVLSTKGGSLPRVLLPYRLFAGGPFGDGEQWWSWIHIADEAAAIRFLIENEAALGPYNLTAPHPVQNDTFGQILAREMGRPHFLPVPAFAMRALFGEVATVVVEGQRVLPARLQEAGYDFRFTELAPALDNLL
ncbi:MAG: TIGR01777 family oxidoreductase [Candidatus Promineifilaceae bacterium]|nr:TIGR01777 family oxidoreductase [Candidatus Promineifilaceae bacterium]